MDETTIVIILVIICLCLSSSGVGIYFATATKTKKTAAPTTTSSQDEYEETTTTFAPITTTTFAPITTTTRAPTTTTFAPITTTFAPTTTTFAPALKEVYGTIGWTSTKAEAEDKCKTIGGTLATKQQLIDAQSAGADWCSTGWVSDETGAMYPSTTNLQQGCGNNEPGIKMYTPPEGKAAVNCYGVKPPKETASTSIYPFSESKWSMYSTETPIEVYGIKGYQYKKDQAESVCKSFGGRVATKQELTEAQLTGKADWCESGWVSDNTKAMYPITTSLTQGCALQPTVAEFTPTTNLAGVNCMGVKPQQTDANKAKINPFNASKWSRYK